MNYVKLARLRNPIEARWPRGRWLLTSGLIVFVVLGLFFRSARAQDPFEVTVSPVFDVDGSGSNVDTIAFWEAPGATDSLMFVTSKNSALVEVWTYPFDSGSSLGNIADSCIDSGSNGVVVDQITDLLYVSIRNSDNVCVYSLPGLSLVRTINSESSYATEPNLALLHLTNGQTRLFVSDDNIFYIHDTADGSQVGRFSPSTGVEAAAGDDFYQVIYVPDEGGGSGIYLYDANGNSAGSNFGDGVFESDGEGILVYACQPGGVDNGEGFIVVSDQKDPINDFEFFDRRTKAYLGQLHISGVNNTDGIASTQQSSPQFPQGIFAAIDDDGSTVGVGWDAILSATGLSCSADEPPGETPVSPTATSAPPTNTPVPPTATSVPPTATAVPPTATSEPGSPTATTAAPTATAVVSPTATSEAPTATPVATNTPAPPPPAGDAPLPTAPVDSSTDSNRPRFEWHALAGSEWYWVWVQDTAGETVYKLPYRAANFCFGATCNVTPVAQLCPGAHTWRVVGWEATAGYSAWSDPAGFTITARTPCSATLQSPADNVQLPAGPLHITWLGDVTATQYWVYIIEEGGNVAYARVHDGTQACLGLSCLATVNLGAGVYRWWVKTINSAGYGPWSAPTLGRRLTIVAGP